VYFIQAVLVSFRPAYSRFYDTAGFFDEWLMFLCHLGTGKSVLLREIIKTLRKKHVKSPDAIAITASTGSFTSPLLRSRRTVPIDIVFLSCVIITEYHLDSSHI